MVGLRHLCANGVQPEHSNPHLASRSLDYLAVQFNETSLYHGLHVLPRSYSPIGEYLVNPL